MSKVQKVLKPGFIGVHIDEFDSIMNDAQGLADLLCAVKVGIDTGLFDPPLEALDVICTGLLDLAGRRDGILERQFDPELVRGYLTSDKQARYLHDGGSEIKDDNGQ